VDANRALHLSLTPLELQGAIRDKDGQLLASVFGGFRLTAIHSTWLPPERERMITACRVSAFHAGHIVTTNAHIAAGRLSEETLFGVLKAGDPTGVEAWFTGRLQDGTVRPDVSRMLRARAKLLRLIEPLADLSRAVSAEIQVEYCRLLDKLYPRNTEQTPEQKARKAWSELEPDRREVLHALNDLGATDEGGRRSASAVYAVLTRRWQTRRVQAMFEEATLKNVMRRLQGLGLTGSVGARKGGTRSGHWLTSLGVLCVTMPPDPKLGTESIGAHHSSPDRPRRRS
jgi:hypothetical protein